MSTNVLPGLKILIAEDSGFMRLILNDILSPYKHIVILDTANNGKEAFEKTQALRPDVVLLDLTMPDYDGMYALMHIMKHCPTPVVVLSGLSHSDPEAILKAMQAGACDFISKPEGLLNTKVRGIGHQIIEKIEAAAQTNTHSVNFKSKKHNTALHNFSSHLAYEVFLLGASTGGTGAIEDILQNIPSNFPLPILIAQHMPPNFIESFASRLDRLLPLPVRVAQEGQKVLPATIYFMPGNQNTGIYRPNQYQEPEFFYSKQAFKEYNHPSVSCLFESAASVYGSKAVAALLTGMGSDGASGLLALKQAGALTIAQDQQSCVVFGMPKAAIELGAATHTLSLDQISNFMVSALG